jgi:hypothetical protein
MIKYEVTQSPVVQDSNQDLAAAASTTPAMKTKESAHANAAVSEPVLAEGSAAISDNGGVIRPTDEGDDPPIKK